MRKTIGTLALVAMMVMGGRAARAQDAGAMAAMQASQQAAQQAAQTNMQMAMNAANDNNYYVPIRPPLPRTPKPMISPDGGRFKGSVQVAISDTDAKAVVFYTTDGTVPTLGSQRYAGPIVVSAKEKVRALAFDLNEMPSGVVSKTFRVKA